MVETADAAVARIQALRSIKTAYCRHDEAARELMDQIEKAFTPGLRVSWYTRRGEGWHLHHGEVLRVLGFDANQADLMVKNERTGKEVKLSVRKILDEMLD